MVALCFVDAFALLKISLDDMFGWVFINNNLKSADRSRVKHIGSKSKHQSNSLWSKQSKIHNLDYENKISTQISKQKQWKDYYNYMIVMITMGQITGNTSRHSMVSTRLTETQKCFVLRKCSILRCGFPLVVGRGCSGSEKTGTVCTRLETEMEVHHPTGELPSNGTKPRT